MSEKKITNIQKIYFSPTGGTKKAVDIIAGVWDEPAEEIDISKKEEDYSQYRFFDSDLCLFGVPSFGGRVPEIALNHIRSMHGSSTPAVLIVAYGNRDYDDTFLELKELLERQGFLAVAAIAAVTEHSIMRQYGSGRPDTRDEEELSSLASQVRETITGAAGSIEKLADALQVPGKKPYREYNGVPMKPKASKKCTVCGACAELCPVGAIPKENPRLTEESKCISCMRCIMVCPVQARKCNALVLSAAAQKMKKACSERKSNELFIKK